MTTAQIATIGYVLYSLMLFSSVLVGTKSRGVVVLSCGTVLWGCYAAMQLIENFTRATQ